MRRGGVAGDHQVQLGHGRRRVREVLQVGCNIADRSPDRLPRPEVRQLLRGRAELQAVELDAGHLQQGPEGGQGQGAAKVGQMRHPVVRPRPAAPDQADAEVVRGPEATSPGRRPRRIGHQVGAAQALRSRIQGQRQGHQRHLDVEGRQGLAPGHDVVDAREARQQGGEARLHLEDDPAPPVGQPGHVAAELQGVAQALFRVDEEGPAREGVLAEPEGLGKASAHPRELPGLPPALIEGPPGTKLAVCEAHHGQVMPGLRVAGGVDEARFQARDGVGQTAQLEERHAPGIVGFGKGRLQRDGAVAAGHGPLQVPQLIEDRGLVVVGLRVVRIEGQRRLAAGQGLPRAAEGQQGADLVAEGVNIAGVQRDGPAEGVQCLLRAIKLGEHDPAVAVGLAEGRLGLDRLVQEQQRVVQTPQTEQGRAQAEIALRRGPAQDDRLGVALKRLLQASEVEQRHPAIAEGVGKVRGRGQGPVEAVEGVLEPAQAAEHRADIEVGAGIGRIDLDLPPVGLQRVLRPTQLDKGPAAIAEGRAVQGIDADGPLAQAECLLEPVQPDEGGAKVGAGGRNIGSDQQGLLQVVDPVVQASGLEADHAQQMQGAEVPRVLSQGQAVVLLRLRKASGLVQGQALGDQRICGSVHGDRPVGLG